MPARPLFLDPALPVLWRSDDTLQVGLDPERGVVVCGVSRDFAQTLRTTSTRAAAGAAVPDELADAPLTRALTLLGASGLLLADDPRKRWALAWVEVLGDGPQAAAVTARLRDSGIGRVTTAPAATIGGPDLVVVTPRWGRGITVADALSSASTVHLWAHLRDGRAVVGPLVVPGESSCLRCHDLARADADPSWPTVAMAWEDDRSTECSPAAVALLAGLVVRQCLTWLRGTRPAAYSGTLEEQPDGEVVRQAWPVHSGCGCGWPGTNRSGGREAPQ